MPDGQRKNLTGFMAVNRGKLKELNDEVLANFQEHGFAAILPKPYQLGDLRRVLSPLLPDVATSAVATDRLNESVDTELPISWVRSLLRSFSPAESSPSASL